MSAAPRLLVPLAALWLLACGGAGAGLAHDFPDDRSDHVLAVFERLQRAPPRIDPAIVVGLARSPMALWAWDLDDERLLWRQEVTADTVPQVAGQYVVTEQSGVVVVRRIEDGQPLLRAPADGLHLRGADGEADIAAIALSTPAGVQARARLLLVRDGRIAWSLDLAQAIGEPAVHADMVFVPWAQQNLSVLEAESGREIARIRYTRGVIGHAIAQGQSIFFGQRGITRLTGHTSSAPEAPWFEPMERDLPGDPGMFPDAYRPPPGPTSATHRVRLVWRATPASGSEPDVGVLDDTIYLVFYRLVFALDALSDTVRWVTRLPGDVVGATAENGGVLLVDEQGQVRALSRIDGRVTWSAQIGQPATWAHVSHTAFQSGPPQGEALPLRDMLLAAIQDSDARLVPARAYAARLLGRLEDPDVTASLVALCDDHGLPPLVLDAACEALAARRLGIDHALAALGRHASFLAGTTAPPIGPLARAVAGAQDRRAVPHLLAHLRDPHTRADDLAPLAEALGRLGDASAFEPLDGFVRLYHAEAEDEALGRGLAAAIHAYAALGGPAAQDTLRWLLDDPATMPAARAAAERALAALTAPPSAEGGTGEAAAQGRSADAEGTVRPDARPLPTHLTTAMITTALEPVEHELASCLVQPGRVFGQARVVLGIMPDGALHTVSVTPTDLQACIEPLVRSQSFPPTRASDRQTVTHIVRR